MPTFAVLGSCGVLYCPAPTPLALAFTQPCWCTQIIANGATLLASLGGLIIMVGFKVSTIVMVSCKQTTVPKLNIAGVSPYTGIGLSVCTQSTATLETHENTRFFSLIV